MDCCLSYWDFKCALLLLCAVWFNNLVFRELSKFTLESSEGENHKIGDSRDTSLKTSARKNMTDNVKEKKEKATTLKKLSSEDKIGKEVMKGKDKPEKEILQPSDAELRETVCRILPEVDINTATFADFREKLAGMYNSDLTHRKHSIKLTS